MFEAKITNGVVSGTIKPLGYVDAAVHGETAGLEIALENVRVSDHAQPSYRAPLVLTLACSPENLKVLALVFAERSGMPLFNDREWRLIADHLDGTVFTGEGVHDPVLHELAARIRKG